MIVSGRSENILSQDAVGSLIDAKVMKNYRANPWRIAIAVVSSPTCLLAKPTLLYNVLLSRTVPYIIGLSYTYWLHPIVPDQQI